MAARAPAAAALAAAALAGAAAALLAQQHSWRLLPLLRRALSSASAEPPCADALWLERVMLRTIPLTRHMRVRALRGGGGDDVSLSLAAPLAPNANVHGTAACAAAPKPGGRAGGGSLFAGSLYATAVLAGWGWVELHARRCAGVPLANAAVVVRSASIRYKAPVAADFVARAEPPTPEVLARFHAEFDAAGKATLPLRVCIWGCASDADAAERGSSEGMNKNKNSAADKTAAAAALASPPPPKPACVLDGEFTALRR